jgi:uncharacterized protein DUF4349
MTLDEVLERGLTAAAEDYEVPSGAVERVREQLAPTAPEERTGDVRRRSRLGWRPSGNAWMGIAAAAVIVLIAVPIAIGGNGGGGEEAGSSSAGSGGTTALTVKGASGARLEAPAPARAPAHVPAGSTAPDVTNGQVFAGPTTGSGSSSGGGAEFGGSPADLVPAPSAGVNRVVKTGQLDLQVGKGQVSNTLSRLADLAALEHGYIADSHTLEAGPAPSGQVTMRVPVQRFEDAVHQARTISGTKVLGLQTSGEDVTSKYVDLQARIRALQATRSTFLTILAKATTIGETLSVQQRITDVQTQIEQLQGQLRVLGDASSLSTLTVTVDQKQIAVATKRPHDDNGFVKAVKLSVSRFVHGIEAIVGVIGPIALVLLVVVLGWLAARFGYRATRRHLV